MAWTFDVGRFVLGDTRVLPVGFGARRDERRNVSVWGKVSTVAMRVEVEGLEARHAR